MSQSASTLAPVRFDADAQAKLSALRRTKIIAAAALAPCILVFALAKSFQASHPWLGLVVARLVPQALAAVEQSRLRDFFTSRMLEQIEKVPLAPLAADLLSAFTEDRRHQKLFDEFTRVVGRFFNDEKALATMREKIREE